jgi:hypothetical protein
VFGYDLISKFEGTPIEIKEAKRLFDEFVEYRADRAPGEEYELVEHWGEDLKLEKYFELVDESEFRNKRTDIDGLLTSIENDPYDIENKDPKKQKEIDEFQKSQQEIGTNMAVVMFMMDALQYFDGMPKPEIGKIAFEIATLGTQGFRPDADNYRISSIKNKTFSGYHILAYYYVSWSIAIPEMVSKLQLPYENEYKLAMSMFKPKN